MALTSDSVIGANWYSFGVPLPSEFQVSVPSTFHESYQFLSERNQQKLLAKSSSLFASLGNVMDFMVQSPLDV